CRCFIRGYRHASRQLAVGSNGQCAIRSSFGPAQLQHFNTSTQLTLIQHYLLSSWIRYIRINKVLYHRCFHARADGAANKIQIIDRRLSVAETEAEIFSLLYKHKRLLARVPSFADDSQ